MAVKTDENRIAQLEDIDNWESLGNQIGYVLTDDLRIMAQSPEFKNAFDKLMGIAMAYGIKAYEKGRSYEQRH